MLFFTYFLDEGIEKYNRERGQAYNVPIKQEYKK